MFSVEETKIGKLTKIILKNKETDEYISIISDFGANITELILSKNLKTYSIIDGYKTEKEILENKGFKSSKLFPFPNRIRDGKYTFNNKTYNLPINKPNENNAIHGLIYNKKFQTIKKETTKDHALVKLTHTNKNLPGYPFKFQLNITYILNNKGFTAITEITNLDSEDMPVADGWHPYFTLNTKIDNFYLKIPSTTKIIVDERMIPTGKTEIFDKFRTLTKIENHVFDTGFKINQKNKATTKLSNKGITINVWQETGKNKYNYLQIYTPPERDSIAIEPMTSNTNAFNNKEGLIILKPNQTIALKYGVYL